MDAWHWCRRDRPGQREGWDDAASNVEDYGDVVVYRSGIVGCPEFRTVVGGGSFRRRPFGYHGDAEPDFGSDMG